MIKGIVFDKDGTLFDFNATWGAWTRGMIATEAGDDPEKIETLANALGYDFEGGVFWPESIVIAETVDFIADALIEHLPDVSKKDLMTRMHKAAKNVPQVQAAPLWPLLNEIKEMDILLGVATNDAEDNARAHLGEADVLDLFDFISGYDSGFGGKPEPGQLLGFCTTTGLEPEDCIMVGDSTHDLNAGNAAGMRTVGVLTGPAQAYELQPYADVILNSIAELPHWIAQQNR
ncbi:MAG: HAD family hydrolase [Yoonia sp.]|jgi:phosphoglycolate phosphatase|nr:HAD family hydrolase [Loktanella sp.]MDO7625811.1 HAD family hydrolase [Loktanella sp.]MDO7630130.1 HAD family hydrolase [Loktanella sp.]MDO7664859.1 HAD family hydrolase [Loktanella sp.]MDO7685782.1 HAD family hydrolase [Loktanella sp.]